jgi:hypothetical protein
MRVTPAYGGSKPFSKKSDDGRGPKHLRKYLVVTKAVMSPWPTSIESPMIASAKRAYNQGLVEICTGRDGDYLNLYAIPRKNQTTRNSNHNR